MTKQTFKVKGMHCVGCAMTIDDALEAIDGVREASANFARQTVTVEYDERKVSPAQITIAIQGVGYQVESSVPATELAHP